MPRRKNEIPSTRTPLHVRFNDAEFDAIDAAIRAQTGKEPNALRVHYVRQAALAATAIDHPVSLSNVIDRYQHLVQACLPELAPAEWQVIFEACAGVLLDHDEFIMRVGDAITRTKLDKKHGVDGRELMSRLFDLSTSARIAVADAIERWHAGEAPHQYERHNA